jgi:hypothetical protein
VLLISDTVPSSIARILELLTHFIDIPFSNLLSQLPSPFSLQRQP